MLAILDTQYVIRSTKQFKTRILQHAVRNCIIHAPRSLFQKDMLEVAPTVQLARRCRKKGIEIGERRRGGEEAEENRFCNSSNRDRIFGGLTLGRASSSDLNILYRIEDCSFYSVRKCEYIVRVSLRNSARIPMGMEYFRRIMGTDFDLVHHEISAK